MPVTKYTYSIADDTANGILDAGLLEVQIQQSAISVEFSYIQTKDDVLDIWFLDVLSSPDQTLLTAIVNTHAGESIQKTRIEILQEIFSAAEPTVQLPRLINGLDKYPSFAYALDDINYWLARARARTALATGDITVDDYHLISSKIPYYTTTTTTTSTTSSTTSSSSTTTTAL